MADALSALLSRLTAVRGQPQHILALVHEAERDFADDEHALSEVLGVAVEVHGYSHHIEDYGFRDLCVKRLNTLCRLNPSEAREFHNRLRTYSVGRADARLYEARAAMEERLGDTAKALKMLQEALRVHSEPSEVVASALKRLQAAAEEPVPAAEHGAPAKNGGEPAPDSELLVTNQHVLDPLQSFCASGTFQDGAAGVDTPLSSPLGSGYFSAVGSPLDSPVIQEGLPFSSGPAAQTGCFGGLPPPLPGGAAHLSQSTKASAAGAVVSTVAIESKAKPRAGRRFGSRGFLGLGTPSRKADGGDSENDEQEEENDRGEAASQLEDGLVASLSGSTRFPLSPIREVDSPAPSRLSKVGYRDSVSGVVPTPLASPACFVTSERKARVDDELLLHVATGRMSKVPAEPQQRTGPQPSECQVPRDADQPSQVRVDERALFVTPCKDRNLLAGATPTAAPPSEPKSGAKVIKVNGVPYMQIQLLGRGGSSKVFLVQDLAGTVYALKRVTTDNPKQLEGYKNEVTLLRKLRGNDCVIQVIDAEIDYERGRIQIVMEHGEMDFHRYLSTEPRLDLSKIQSLWMQMLEAVQVIHNARIVHSDLKPQNFILVQGRLKVIDFGIAKQISNDTTNISRECQIGTLSYMAPEAIKQGPLKLGRASDIWSLGIILYQMVYKRLPLAHLDQIRKWLTMNDPNFHIEFPPEHCLVGHSVEVQAHLRDVLERCLHRDPRRRPSIPELLQHPLVCTRQVVPRHAFDTMVVSLLSNILGQLGQMPQQAQMPNLVDTDMQVLLDEAWEWMRKGRAEENHGEHGDIASAAAPKQAVASNLLVSKMHAEIRMSWHLQALSCRPSHPNWRPSGVEA
eukprot:TRINITY_DN336_c1_g1_i1.p1 TRINITY_DN336_c1_g1~~TRINITY_DN336_c1_g1_i1.p1  ORF type:complete len:854 (-),score=147.81 TRINITY_DN336_c1_g1_i1:343-2904(-)